MRFHTLPGSKRYPDTEGEYKVVLDRHNTVVAELAADGSVLVVSAGYSGHPDPGGDVRDRTTAACSTRAVYWTSVLTDPDPEPGSWMHLYVEDVA